LERALPKVKALYASGEVKPIEGLGQSAAASGTSTGGTPAAATAESACSAADLRKALTSKDETFLEGLGGKTVVVQGMLLLPPKADGDIAVGKVMAGGGALAVAFPLKTKAATLPMATKVVVTGIVAKMGEKWQFKANTWGKAKDLQAGREPTQCNWE
jgi:hypothetical protein